MGDMASAGGFSNAGAHSSRLQPRQRHARLACAPRVTEGVLGVGHSQGHTTLETIHHSTDPEILVAWIHLGYILDTSWIHSDIISWDKQGGVHHVHSSPSKKAPRLKPLIL